MILLAPLHVCDPGDERVKVLLNTEFKHNETRQEQI